jgi:adenylate cyclase
MSGVGLGRRAVRAFSALRRQLTGARIVTFLLVLALCVLRTWDPKVLETARQRSFDLYQQIKPQPKPPVSPVAIIDIDEASLAELGQWPWRRTLVAQMLHNLAAAGAVLVGFDIVFAEPDRTSPGLLAESLTGLDDSMRARLREMPSNDSVLAEAMQRIKVVVGQPGSYQPPRKVERIPEVPSIAEIGAGDPRPYLDTFTSILRNTPEIDFAAAGWGLITPTPEADGVVRRVPAIVTDGTSLYPALSIEMLRLAFATQNLGIRTNQSGVTGIAMRVGQSRLVTTDDHARIWVYAGEHDPSLYVPAKDVIAGTFDPALVRGKLILVGTSAAGLEDIRQTAVQANIPGVEVHAQIITTILFNLQLTNPPDAVGVELAATLLGALLMINLVPMVGARWTLLLLIVVAGGLAGLSWHQFDAYRTLYDPVFPATVTLITFILMSYASYADEEKRRQQVRSVFNRYMSPAMIDQVISDPRALKLGGEKREMTLLFCDVRGFTTISEMFDAVGLTRLINRFLSPMTEIILARKGTIDKYMGDCIMAFWNAPLDDPEHAPNACSAALGMNRRLAALNQELEGEAKAENRRHVPIKIGIGLNSGPAVVGNMGCDLRMDYSCLGDTVNTASRLEGQSKAYGVTIVIGENTRAAAPDFAVLELDVIQVQGKTAGVRIYALLGEADLAGRPDFVELTRLQTDMLTAYRGQDWAKCRDLIAACRGAGQSWDLDHLYDLFEKRVAEYEKDPPGPGWDGVYVAKSK